MARSKLVASQSGRLVYVKYIDCVLFVSGDPEVSAPTVREAVGWVTHQNESYVTLVFDRGLETSDKSTGLVIPRRNILELRGVG